MALQKYVRQLRPIKNYNNKTQFTESYDIFPKSEGEIDTTEINDYNSHNTKRLNVNEIKLLLGKINLGQNNLINK